MIEDDDKVLPIRPPEVIAEVGGVVDESGVTLAVYGADLDPEHVTQLLGVEPTESFHRGFQKGPRSPPLPHGAWFLQVRGEAPNGPGVQLGKLMMRLPNSPEVWAELRSAYRVQFRVGIHMEGWNRGFELNPDVIARVAATGIGMTFDIYAYGEENAEDP